MYLVTANNHKDRLLPEFSSAFSTFYHIILLACENSSWGICQSGNGLELELLLVGVPYSYFFKISSILRFLFKTRRVIF